MSNSPTEQLRQHGTATSAAGVHVSTVEQSGQFCGQSVGRVWIRFPDEGARWHWYGLASCVKAKAVAHKLLKLSAGEVRDYMSD